MMSFLKKHIKWFCDAIRENNIESLSAHAALFIIISFIPFIAILLLILQKVNISSTIIINWLLTVFPQSVADYINEILRSSVISTTGIISVSVITFIWIASSGMRVIIRGLNKIYNVKESRNFILLRLIAMVYIVAFAVAIALTAVLLVFGSTLYAYILENTNQIIVVILSKFKSLFGFILLSILFFIMFITVSKKKIKPLYNLAGAVISAAGWVIFSYFFSIFVDNFSNYPQIYGSLATIVIVAYWLYTCMIILFIGAEISMWLQYSGIKKDIKELLSGEDSKKETRRLKLDKNPPELSLPLGGLERKAKTKDSLTIETKPEEINDSGK